MYEEEPLKSCRAIVKQVNMNFKTQTACSFTKHPMILQDWAAFNIFIFLLFTDNCINSMSQCASNCKHGFFVLPWQCSTSVFLLIPPTRSTGSGLQLITFKWNDKSLLTALHMPSNKCMGDEPCQTKTLEKVRMVDLWLDNSTYVKQTNLKQDLHQSITESLTNYSNFSNIYPPFLFV